MSKKLKIGIYIVAVIALISILAVVFIHFFHNYEFNLSGREEIYKETFNIELKHPEMTRLIFSSGDRDPVYMFTWYYEENEIKEMIGQDFWKIMDEGKVKSLLNDHFLRWVYEENDTDSIEKYKKHINDDLFFNDENLYAFFEIDKFHYALLLLDVDKNVIYEFFENI